ncbi:DUF3486 family protein [Afifella pfennigii]|uniref:DUF3486 family protein n=1 Tax=Afifella pfennigii TaxID=209897 RepID=UPI00047E3C38|nr:DUF3486 family protein [Afifella pfennigii]
MARLSSIQTIPDEALGAVQWAFERIVERRMTQKAVLEGLNERLAPYGIKASRSSFNRYAGRVLDGKVQRPEVLLPAAEGAVFAPIFRERLSRAVGAAAAQRIEIAMLALCEGGEA